MEGSGEVRAVGESLDWMHVPGPFSTNRAKDRIGAPGDKASAATRTVRASWGHLGAVRSRLSVVPSRSDVQHGCST